MNDLIYRQAAIDAIKASASKYSGFMEMEMYTDDDAIEAIKKLPSAQEWISFAHWVASEVIDEGNWDLNCISFPEIACRKLNKLGIIDTDGERWIYTPPKEE